MALDFFRRLTLPQQRRIVPGAQWLRGEIRKGYTHSAFLLTSEYGNYLFHGLGDFAPHVEGVKKLGGVSRQFLGNLEERTSAAEGIFQTFGAPLVVWDAEQDTLPKVKLHVMRREADDLYLPNVTALPAVGPTWYLFRTRGLCALLPSRSVWIEGGRMEWEGDLPLTLPSRRLVAQSPVQFVLPPRFKGATPYLRMTADLQKRMKDPA